MDSQTQLSVVDGYQATLDTLLAADQQLAQNPLQGVSLGIHTACLHS